MRGLFFARAIALLRSVVLDGIEAVQAGCGAPKQVIGGRLTRDESRQRAHPAVYQVCVSHFSPRPRPIPHQMMRSPLDSPPYPSRFPHDAPSRGIDADDAIRGTDDDALTSRLSVSSYGVVTPQQG